MEVIVKLYSNTQNEISKFLNTFFTNSKKENSYDGLEWQKKYQNPTEIVDIIGTFIENKDKFKINMWISLDKGFFLNVTDHNADQIIRYLFERYPY